MSTTDMPHTVAHQSADSPRASRPMVWLIGFFAFVNVYSMQSILPWVMRDLQASPVEAGLTVGATVLGIALVSPFMGMLSDAWGRRGLIRGGMLAMVLPTAALALASSLEQVLLLRFMQGLFIPGIVVVLMAYISEEFAGREVAVMISTYVGGSIMGGFSGRFIAGHAAHWFDWQGAFVTLALLDLIGALLVWRYLPPSRHFVPHRHMADALGTLFSHGRNRRLLAACAVGFGVLFSLVGAFTYANLHLAQPPFDLGAAGLANVFTVYLLGVVVTPVASRLITRHGYLNVLLLALGLSSLGWLCTLVPTLATVIGGLAIGSTGVFVCQSCAIGFISHNVSSGRSLATGLYNMCYYAGGACGSVLAGLAYQGAGWGGTVLSLLLVQALAAVVAWRGWRPH